MNTEKPPQLSSKPKKAQAKIKEPANNPDTNSAEQKQNSAYLNFTDDEKNEIVRKITEDYVAKGFDTKNHPLNFPAEQIDIGGWACEYPQHFKTERLIEIALKIPDLAPELTKKIAERKEYDQVIKILKHYIDGPRFDHCVVEIESSLKDDEQEDKVLMKLSDVMAEDEKTERVEFEKFSKHMFDRPEAAARDTQTYLKYLKINDELAKKLLDKKSLLLIGGGIAPIKDELLNKKIDCEITNIEPLLEDEHKGNSDHPIPKNFYDVDMEKLEKYDEVWSANNSLPTYAFNPEQVRTFYQRALSTVSQGGHLRILPVSGFKDAITPAMRLNRIPTNNESIQCFELLKQRPDLFAVEEFETPPIKVSGPAFKKWRTMEGVDIKVIGDKEKIDIFLKNFANKKYE